MLKKRIVKRLVVHQVVCDKCGKEMVCAQVLASYPPQYCYCCPTCETGEVSQIKSGTVEYEFEEEEDV